MYDSLSRPILVETNEGRGVLKLPIVFSSIRGTIYTEGAEKMLDALYAEFFPRETNPPPKASRISRFAPSRIFEALRSQYGADIDNKLAILPNLEVIGLKRHIQPVFGFQNKYFHVVFPRYFNSKRCEEQVGFGLLLLNEMNAAKEEIWRGAKPAILGIVQQSSDDLSRQISETFKRLEIQFYADEQTLIRLVA